MPCPTRGECHLLLKSGTLITPMYENGQPLHGFKPWVRHIFPLTWVFFPSVRTFFPLCGLSSLMCGVSPTPLAELPIKNYLYSWKLPLPQHVLFFGWKYFKRAILVRSVRCWPQRKHMCEDMATSVDFVLTLMVKINDCLPQIIHMLITLHDFRATMDSLDMEEEMDVTLRWNGLNKSTLLFLSRKVSIFDKNLDFNPS